MFLVLQLNFFGAHIFEVGRRIGSRFLNTNLMKAGLPSFVT